MQDDTTTKEIVVQYDLKYYGLQAIVRTMEGDTPLSNQLLRHISFYNGRCSALMLPNTTREDISNCFRNGFHMDIGVNSLDSKICLARILKEESLKLGKDACLLAEDPYITRELYANYQSSGVSKAMLNPVFCDDRAYWILANVSAASISEIVSYINNAQTAEEYPLILTKLPAALDLVLKDRELELSDLETGAKNCEIMVSWAFDFTSYVLWESGKLDQSSALYTEIRRFDPGEP